MTLSLDLQSLRAAYAAGATAPANIVSEIHGRIRAAGETHAWITLVPEEIVREKARTAPPGALHGIPFAVKDNIDVAGLPTTCACPEFAYTPQRSARVVELLEAQGAVLIGKTNLDQFATGLNGTRSPYGIPASAFDARYISGGSSSGSAVAVARGFVSFALGTDTAGSGRVPAAFNNLVGLKPTKGLVSTRGVVPACRTQDVVSIFALTTGDAMDVLCAVAQFDEEDAFSRPPPRAVAAEAMPSSLRLGAPASELEFFGDQSSRALYSEAIARAEGLGAAIVPFDFEPFAEAAKLLYAGPWVAERLAAIAPFARADPQAMHDVVREIVLGGARWTAVDAFEGLYRLSAYARAAEAEWSKMDAMLLPTAGTTYTIASVLADPVALNSNLGRYTNFVNLLDLSALALPAGFRPDGLPFGVTLIARAFDDGFLAAFGDRMHRALCAARLGATQTALERTTPLVAASRRTIEVAVVGAHLTGQPLNWQLTERAAKFVRTAQTAPGYSLYALAGTPPSKPGLVFDCQGAGRIEIEIWEMDVSQFGSFVALIPPPLGIGTIRIDDGTAVKGFLCEPYAVSDATDITSFGGWRTWLASAAQTNTSLQR